MSANLTTPQHKPTLPSPAGAGQPNPNAEPQQSASGVAPEMGDLADDLAGTFFRVSVLVVLAFLCLVLAAAPATSGGSDFLLGGLFATCIRSLCCGMFE